MNIPNDLSSPLTGDEFEFLDRFLLDRVDQSEGDTERNVGILDVSELDGFLTAIVSGPEPVIPSVWMPAVWGEFEPAWRSEDELATIFALLMRHMNSIAWQLMNQPEAFEPLFGGRMVDDEEYLIVDDWCAGYLRGIALTAGAWRDGGERIETLLQPLFAFGTPSGWDALEDLEEDEELSLQQSIAPSARAIHRFWLSRRGPEEGPDAGSPFRYDSPRAGRNDPCPCGSGKKYKHCCLH